MVLSGLPTCFSPDLFPILHLLLHLLLSLPISLSISLTPIPISSLTRTHFQSPSPTPSPPPIWPGWVLPLWTRPPAKRPPRQAMCTPWGRCCGSCWRPALPSPLLVVPTCWRSLAGAITRPPIWPWCAPAGSRSPPGAPRPPSSSPASARSLSSAVLFSSTSSPNLIFNLFQLILHLFLPRHQQFHC